MSKYDDHEHTGHGPDNTLDCPGCRDAYNHELREAAVRRDQAAAARPNAIIVAGAVMGALYNMPATEDVRPTPDDPTALHLRLSFMNSRYRVTVTMDPDGDWDE